MKPIDRYLKWVEWSEEDQTYIGRCPDLISGIHGDNPIEVYEQLCEVVTQAIDHLATSPQGLPPARTRPMQEVP